MASVARTCPTSGRWTALRCCGHRFRTSYSMETESIATSEAAFLKIRRIVHRLSQRFLGAIARRPKRSAAFSGSMSGSPQSCAAFHWGAFLMALRRIAHIVAQLFMEIWRAAQRVAQCPQGMASCPQGSAVVPREMASRSQSGESPAGLRRDVLL